jgi:hypothetical protein
MTTKNRIAEQVSRIYARFVDKENVSDILDLREVRLLVEQSMNKVLKIQTSEYFKAGSYEIPRSALITKACAVVSESPGLNRAYITLPAIPLNLPLDMGIWAITAPSQPLAPYIPLPAQDVIVFQGTNVSYLENQIGYYLQGKRVYFTKDITLTANGTVTSVNVQLLVMDFREFADDEMLPISPEVEMDVINDVMVTLSNGKVAQAELQSEKLQEQ